MTSPLTFTQINKKHATIIMESIDGYSEVYGKASGDREDFQASNIGMLVYLLKCHIKLNVSTCTEQNVKKRGQKCFVFELRIAFFSNINCLHVLTGSSNIDNPKNE